MFENYYKQKREKYIETINEMFKLPDTEEKIEKLSKLLTDYSLFCYKHNLSSYDIRIADSENESYILPSEPEMYELNEEDTMAAASHLKEALAQGSGISEEEAETLLKWSIGKAREEMADGNVEKFKKASLNGCCGYGQALTLIPFMNIGVPVTINNASELPFASYRHAFGTVELPILNNGVVEKRRYLLDSTYRQFYSLTMNHEGRFWSADDRFKGKVGPAAGFYVIKYPGGREMALELLNKGYIKLDASTSKAYGIGFTCESLNINNVDKMDELFNLREELYWNSILNGNQELDFDESEIKDISDKVDFPKGKLSR